MAKNGGSLGELGCVNWMFEKKGLITILNKEIDEEKVLEILDMEIEDFNQEDEFYEIITTPENFNQISKKLEKQNIEIEGQISLLAKNAISVSKEDSTKIIKLLELIEEQEDVQKVHSNFVIN